MCLHASDGIIFIVLIVRVGPGSNRLGLLAATTTATFATPVRRAAPGFARVCYTPPMPLLPIKGDHPLASPQRRCPWFLVLAVVALNSACAHTPAPSPVPPGLSAAAATKAIPAHVVDKSGWAEDIVVAIRLLNKSVTAERVCAVSAIIEQESGFRADPAVKGLPAMVRQGLEDKLDRLGPLKGAAVDAILDHRAPGQSETFGARVQHLKTERDLDVLFRDLADAYREQYPGGFVVAEAMGKILGKGGIESLNPVTTAGSMQVKVDFARAHGADEGLSDAMVRELLYTRGGGVRFGTARLIGYQAQYTDIRHRFADYNSGLYASRNAAFQAQVSVLTGIDLVQDGDLLAYDDDGDVSRVDSNSLKALLVFGAAHGLSARTVRRDVALEKQFSFEETATWKAARAAFVSRTKKPAPYAQVPNVSLRSPKLSRPRTTAWFADNVVRRYRACRDRLSP